LLALDERAFELPTRDCRLAELESAARESGKGTCPQPGGRGRGKGALVGLDGLARTAHRLEGGAEIPARQRLGLAVARTCEGIREVAVDRFGLAELPLFGRDRREESERAEGRG
jgi:hypothetical protein